MQDFASDSSPSTGQHQSRRALLVIREATKIRGRMYRCSLVDKKRIADPSVKRNVHDLHESVPAV
jgi:hypothetical protein